MKLRKPLTVLPAPLATLFEVTPVPRADFPTKPVRIPGASRPGVPTIPNGDTP